MERGRGREVNGGQQGREVEVGVAKCGCEVVSIDGYNSQSFCHATPLTNRQAGSGGKKNPQQETSLWNLCRCVKFTSTF